MFSILHSRRLHQSKKKPMHYSGPWQESFHRTVDVSGMTPRRFKIIKTGNHLLAIRCGTHRTRPKRIQGTLNAEQYLCTIWLLRNGPRRDDIGTQYLANFIEKSLRYRFNLAGFGSDLLKESTVYIWIDPSKPHTSRLSTIKAIRVSNASPACGVICLNAYTK